MKPETLSHGPMDSGAGTYERWNKDGRIKSERSTESLFRPTDHLPFTA